MGILDVLRVPVHACVSGEITGPALGVLVSCPRDDAHRGRTLTTAQAIGYGLIQSQETASRPPGPAGLAGPPGPRPH
jgi:hypothetical protein